MSKHVAVAFVHLLWIRAVHPRLVCAPRTIHTILKQGKIWPRTLYSDSLRDRRSGDQIALGARFSAPVQTSPGALPGSSTKVTGCSSGVQRPKRGVVNPHLALRLKKEYSHTSGASWPVLGKIFLFPHNIGLQDFSLPLCFYVSIFKPIDLSVPPSMYILTTIFASTNPAVYLEATERRLMTMLMPSIHLSLLSHVPTPSIVFPALTDP